jgi:hypothetical protein
VNPLAFLRNMLSIRVPSFCAVLMGDRSVCYAQRLRVHG